MPDLFKAGLIGQKSDRFVHSLRVPVFTWEIQCWVNVCSDPLAKRSALISIYCAFPIFAHGVFRNELYNLFLKDIIVHFISFSQSFTLEKEKWSYANGNLETETEKRLWPSKFFTRACEYSVDAWFKFFSACLYCFYAKIRQLFWRVAVLTTCLLRRPLP